MTRGILWGMIICERCQGAGWLRIRLAPSLGGEQRAKLVCPDCLGKGRVRAHSTAGEALVMRAADMLRELRRARRTG
jgi:DnaJ-class molecular chaperone